MSLYPKIDDFSILLDNDCKKMLRRNSKKLIICEVIEKLFNNSNNSNNTNNTNNSNNTNNTNNTINNSKKKLLEIDLNILGCNKS